MSKKNKEEKENLEPFNEQDLNIEPQPIDELAERKAKYKKIFPYSEWVSYTLTDEEKEFIGNLDERKLKVEDIAEFKRLHKVIFNDSIIVSSNCGACISMIKAKLVKLKLFRNTQL